jgi:hypothetical protein
MTSISKLLLCGAVAAMAIAISSAPSEAAKRRAASASCVGPAVCSHSCAQGACQINACGLDGKWHMAFLTPVCAAAHCPKKC